MRVKENMTKEQPVNKMHGKNQKKLPLIKTKVFISFCAVSLLTVIFNSGLSYYKYKKTTNVQLAATSKQAVDEINNGLTRYMNAILQVAGVAAKMPDLQREPEAVLKELVERYDVIECAYVATQPNGLVIYPFEEGVAEEDDTQRPWYVGAAKAGDKPYLTPVYIDTKKNKAMITISMAINDHQVLGIDINLENLEDELSKSQIGKTGYLVVTDADGLVLAHPDEKKIGAESWAEAPVWQAISTGKQDFEMAKIDGNDKYISYLTNEATGWRIIGIMEEAEISAPLKGMLANVIVNSCIILFIMIIISHCIGKWVEKKIKRLVEVFNQVAEGDLTPRIHSQLCSEADELMECFNDMLTNISAMITDAAHVSGQMKETSQHFASVTGQTNAAASEVATAINQITIGATNVAQDVAKAGDDMESMKNNVSDARTHIQEVNKITEDTHKISNEGLSIVKDLGNKSTKAKEATAGIQGIMEQMNVNAIHINSISEVISGITEETNLLALNASIEAARAGEAGRGFSVVADEIRKLAEESNKSTEKIKAILNQTQQLVTSTNNNITETMTLIEAEDEAVQNTVSIFNSILASVDQLMTKSNVLMKIMENVDKSGYALGAQVGRINEETQETMSATEEVNASTEEISASIEDLATGIEGLEKLSSELSGLIEKFNI